MTLKEFIEKNDVDTTTNIVSQETLKSAEEKVGVMFGKELKEYLLKYGYLAFKYIELYGMNSNQNLDSDLVKQTLYLHKYFPETTQYVAIENQGEGDYFLVDSNDKIFEYDSELKKLSPKKCSLFEYILSRFEEAK